MGTRQILVVEDDFDSREMLRVLLEGEGYAVTPAEGVGEALRLLDTFKPDLVVTDLMMPLVMGEVLIAFVRGRSDLAHIPVVVLTGYRRAFGDAAIAAGATEVLEKPVDVPRLLAAVKRLLGTQP